MCKHENQNSDPQNLLISISMASALAASSLRTQEVEAKDPQGKLANKNSQS